MLAKAQHSIVDTGRNAPEVIFYVSEGCPICKKVKDVIINEIERRTIIDPTIVNVDYNRSVMFSWWQEASIDMSGEEVTPMIVIWNEGFMNGTADIYVVERKNYDILTENLTQKVLALTPKVWQHLEQFEYGRRQYA